MSTKISISVASSNSINWETDYQLLAVSIHNINENVTSWTVIVIGGAAAGDNGLP